MRLRPVLVWSSPIAATLATTSSAAPYGVTALLSQGIDMNASNASNASNVSPSSSARQHPFVTGVGDGPRRSLSRARDVAILVARVLLMLLFLIFGWDKLTGYADTVSLFTQMGVPQPPLATMVAIAAEVGGGLAIMLGLFTRPMAALMAVYCVATALLGHHYWALSGNERFLAEIGFFKNLSIAGGLLLLCVTGSGRIGVDATLRR